MICPKCKTETNDPEYCPSCEQMTGVCPKCHELTLMLDEDGSKCQVCDYETRYPGEQWTWVPGVGFVNEIGERW